MISSGGRFRQDGRAGSTRNLAPCLDNHCTGRTCDVRTLGLWILLKNCYFLGDGLEGKLWFILVTESSQHGSSCPTPSHMSSSYLPAPDEARTQPAEATVSEKKPVLRITGHQCSDCCPLSITMTWTRKQVANAAALGLIVSSSSPSG